MFPANCGVASVFRATQVSPLRLAAASCGVASVVRAVMDVGAPFMTPGAGTAQPVRGVVRGGVRDDAGQLRRCGGFPGDTSVAPTFGGGILRRCVGWRAVMDVGAPFMTPGAGTAQPVRGIARGGVRGVSGQLRRCDGYPGDTNVAPTLGGVCGGHVVCRRVETVGRLVFPVAVTVFPDGRSLLLVTTSVNAHRLMDFRGGEETFCSTKLD